MKKVRSRLLTSAIRAPLFALLVPYLPLAATPHQAIQDSTTLAGEDSVYAPAPILSPSSQRLVFEGIFPGQSKTLFMDLANLGIGEILVDSLSNVPEGVQVEFDAETLRPGQFMRFPVTMTQPDLQLREATITFEWYSPIFDKGGSISIQLVSTAMLPLAPSPVKILWAEVLEGGTFHRQLSLINRGREPIFFGPTTLPGEVTLQALPPVLPGEQTAHATFAWSPTSSYSLDTVATFTYVVASDSGTMTVPLAGISIAPVRFALDTLQLDAMMAGSRYRRTVRVLNHTDHPVSMILESIVSDPPMGAQWISFAPELDLGPGQARDLPVSFAPSLAGRFYVTATYAHRPSDSSGEYERLPSVPFVISADIVLPVTSDDRTLQFGVQAVYQSGTRSVRVVNRGHGPVAVKLAQGGDGPSMFSFKAEEYSIPPARMIDIPIYFKPQEMVIYNDSIDVVYTTFNATQKLRVALTGEGGDQPLQRIGSIGDVSLDEDFQGWFEVADLSKVFIDPNHALTYQIVNPLEGAINIAIEESRFRISSVPNRYGSGDVILRAVNTMDEVEADTFHLDIRSVNDLPRLAVGIDDLVLDEDAESMVVARLSEMFTDADRDVDTVTTNYSVHAATGSEEIDLVRQGDELYLTVAPDWSGNRSFVISAIDPVDTTVAAFDAFTVTILPVNDPPYVAALPPISMQEDRRTTVYWEPYIFDPDDEPTNLSMRFLSEDGAALPLAFIPSGPLESIIQPHPNWSGTVVVSLILTDPHGGKGGKTFNVTVEPENDAPLAFKAKGPLSKNESDRIMFDGDTLITFEWEASVNLDPSDVVSYTWQLLNSTGTTILDELAVGEALTIDVLLSRGGHYLWTVNGHDGAGEGATSDTLALVLESTAALGGTFDGGGKFGIGPNHPNPFNTSTTIKYQVPRFSSIAISIFDATGRQVRKLVEKSLYQGDYSEVWDGRDDGGRTVPSGPYVAEIRSGDSVAHLKIVVLH